MIKKLLLVLALTFPLIADEKPIPDLPDLPDLVAQADRYQLPKPPKDAKLILANTGWTTTIGNSSTDLDPSIYEAGHLLKARKDGTVQVICGFTKFIAKPYRTHQPASLPFTANPPASKYGGYAFRGNSLTTFATSVQCARLGDLKNAQALAQLVLNSQRLNGFQAQERSQKYKENLPLLLARITYEFYYQDLRKKDPVIKKALAMLDQLKAEFPTLFSDDPEKYDEHPRSTFLNDLRLTAKSPTREKDSIEDLLYQAAFSNVPSHNRKPSHPSYQIYLQGTSVIPELVRLSTSRKLTPAVQEAIMNRREVRNRLGHLASQALIEMTGANAPEKTDNTLDGIWRTWLTKTDLSDEKSFFTKALAKPRDDSYVNAEIPLAILFHRFPNDTLDLAKKLAKTKHLSDFISALMVSPVDKATKVQALLTLSEKQKGLDRRYMLQNLAKLDPDAAAKEILPLIKTLPKDVNKPYWTAQEANLTYILASIDDPDIWKSYLAKTKTCSIGLRMEIMQGMRYRTRSRQNDKLRLAFLAAFLNDSEVRTVNRKDKRWDGPHAGFSYDTLSVQNFVAEKISSILKLPGQPADHWTEKQWSPYRQKVQQALDKLTLPDIS